MLELAGGTGHWTASLAGYATRLTVLDASEETLAINRAKSAARRDVVADIYDWQPARRYDVVFFPFWLSHVPPGRFEAVWQLVDRALRPGGRVFFIDSALSTSHPLDHVRWDDPGPGISLRQLDDGRQYNIVKVFWQPAALGQGLATLGFDIIVRKTSHQYCIYGQGSRRQDP